MPSGWHGARVGPFACATLHLPEATVCWSVPDAATLDAGVALLCPDERAQAARFRHAADRLAYVTAHALKRLLLAQASGGMPAQLDFVRTATGKPMLRTGALHFSLSHCREAVAVAFSATAALGVDVEVVDAGGFDPAVEAAAFAPAERAQLTDATDRAAVLLELWTLREALGKATGQGLGGPGEHHWFDRAERRVRDLDPRWGRSEDWRFHSWSIAPRLALALAIAPDFPDGANRA